MDRRGHSRREPPRSPPSFGSKPGCGALVNSVASDGPGAKAELKPGDIVATVDGKRIHDAQDFHS